MTSDELVELLISDNAQDRAKAYGIFARTLREIADKSSSNINLKTYAISKTKYYNGYSKEWYNFTNEDIAWESDFSIRKCAYSVLELVNIILERLKSEYKEYDYFITLHTLNVTEDNSIISENAINSELLTS